MISDKKSRIACNAGVIHVISIFTELPCSSFFFFFLFFLACALSGYIFVNPFTSCVPDRYQYKQCIIMETETETNMKIC